MYEPQPLFFAPNARRDADLQALAEYVASELRNVSKAATSTVDFVQLNVLHAEPKKMRAGMVVFADGSDFDPSSLGVGEGLYYRNAANTAWVFMA